jgi:hypothetical protein
MSIFVGWIFKTNRGFPFLKPRKCTQHEEKPTQLEGNPPNARETHPMSWNSTPEKGNPQKKIMEFHLHFVKSTMSEKNSTRSFENPLKLSGTHLRVVSIWSL